MQFSPRVERYLIIGTYELQAEQPGSPADDQNTEVSSTSSVKPQSRAGSLLLYELAGNQL